MIDALLLDLGNVFAFHDNALLFERLGALFGTDAKSFQARLDGEVWFRANTGGLPGDALRRELQRQLGGEVTAADFAAAWNCHFTIHEEMVAAVTPLVGRIKLGLLSNTHDLHYQWLRARLPILGRFDAVVLSYEEGLAKPDPRLYRRALDRLGASAERTAFFDDVARYAEGASAVGIAGRVFVDAAGFQRDLAALGV